MLKFSQRAEALQPSATFAMTAKAKELARQGKKIISFTQGEPDFDTPEHIKEATKRALDEGFTKYTPVGGIPELKEAIVAKLKRDNQIDYTSDEIVVTCGAKQAIFNTLMTLIDDGDEVIIPAPYWVSYPEMVKLCGGHPKIVETREADRFNMSAAQLEKAITPKTKALLLCSPSNPTGSCYTLKELAALADVAATRNIALISDEIYEHLVYDQFQYASIVTAAPHVRPQTILINGVSKAYSMTGWRMGFAAGPKTIISKIQALQGQQTSNITSFVQKSCIAALTGPQDEVEKMRRAFESRRNVMFEKLTALSGVTCLKPEGAFYLFPNMSAYLGKKWTKGTIQNATDLANYLLEEVHISCMSGDPFGAPGYLRFSYATSKENIEEGMKRLQQGLEELS